VGGSLTSFYLAPSCALKHDPANFTVGNVQYRKRIDLSKWRGLHGVLNVLQPARARLSGLYGSLSQDALILVDYS
jgi:hypothetical protein